MARVFTLGDTFKLTAAVAVVLILGREGLRQESWLFGWGLLLSVIIGAGLLLHVGDRLAVDKTSNVRLYVLLAIVLLLIIAATQAPRFF